MSSVDFILNLAGLLLWVNWRSLPFDPIHKRTPATLVGTLRRAAPSHFRRWHLLAILVALLVLRALIYWWIGPAFKQVWVGKLDFGVTILPFRSDWFLRILAFSFFSFGKMLGIFYCGSCCFHCLTDERRLPNPFTGWCECNWDGSTTGRSG
ncbi:MAG: hypothetical protein WDN00_14285 [Limisphaerales bacterium]